jgi:hypothetical protein
VVVGVDERAVDVEDRCGGHDQQPARIGRTRNFSSNGVPSRP